MKKKGIKAFENTFENICRVAGDNEKASEIVSAVGEVTINGKVYQIQLILKSDKRAWINKDEVMALGYRSKEN